MTGPFYYGATTKYLGLGRRPPRAPPSTGVAPPDSLLGGRESLRKSALVADRLNGGGPVVWERGGIDGTGGTLSPPPPLPNRGELLRRALLGEAVAARGGGTMAGGASALSPLEIHRLAVSS